MKYFTQVLESKNITVIQCPTRVVLEYSVGLELLCPALEPVVVDCCEATDGHT